MATNYSKLSAARIQKLAKDPGSRSKIPDRYLPQQYRAMRKQNQMLAQPVTPGSSYTNRQAAEETNATVGLRYGQAEAQGKAQVAAIPQWYDQYKQQLAANQAGIQAGYAAANQQFQALQAGTGSAAAQGQQDTQAYQQQQAALGGVADPNAAAVASQAAAQRQSMAGSLGGVLAAQGGNAAAYGGQQQMAAGKSQLEALMQELDSQRKMATEKGQFTVQTRQGIVDRERKQLLENKAFDLNVANTAADNARSDAQAAAQVRDQTERRKIARANARNKTAGPGGTYTAKEWAAMTPAQRTKAAADYAAATRKPTSGASIGKPRQEPASSLQFRRLLNARSESMKKYIADNFPGGRIKNGTQRQALVAMLRKDHSGYFRDPSDEKLLSAALDLATGGYIRTDTLRFLRKQGVYVTRDGNYWGGGNR